MGAKLVWLECGLGASDARLWCALTTIYMNKCETDVTRRDEVRKQSVFKLLTPAPHPQKKRVFFVGSPGVFVMLVYLFMYIPKHTHTQTVIFES